MFAKTRKSVVIGLTSVLAVSTILSASAASTTKNLSSNFTLVNLFDGPNQGQISYVLENGQPWRTENPDPGFEDSFTMAALGSQVERRQYFDAKLPAGSGSVVVSTDGPVGAVVQIQARNQSASNGAYIGVSEGSTEASLPLVMRRRGTASGLANSQIIVQNASGNPIAIKINFYDGVTGAEVAGSEVNLASLPANAAHEYDLDEMTTLPENWYGAAVITSPTAGGEVAVVTNLFAGSHALQTYNAFSTTKKGWGIPLFASRLLNGLSTPVVIQNKSGSTIPVDAVTLSCKIAATSPAKTPTEFTRTNKTAIPNNSAFFDFNPVVFTDPNTGFPDNWSGACTISSTFDTALIAQMRVVGKEADGNERADAYEAIPLDGTSKVVVVPLWARRLENGFASNVTILNLSSTATANVQLVYKGTPNTVFEAACNATFSRQIEPNGALRQNHRVEDGVDDSVPELPVNCQGTLVVTSSDQPINGFVQLDQLDLPSNTPPAGQVSGDRFMAHNVFLLP